MRSSILFASILLAGPVLASPGSLKQAAVDAHRGDAQHLLGKAKTDATGLRLRASDRNGILGEQTKKTRSEIAGKLRGSRTEVRQLKLSFSDTTRAHGTAASTLDATKVELASAKTTMDKSHGSLSWLARNLRFAITPKGRSALKQYRTDRDAHEVIETRSASEQEHLDSLSGKLKDFEAGLEHARGSIGEQRGRDIPKEAESRTVAEIAALERSAIEVENAARSSVRSLVSTYVKNQTAAQRNPLQRVKDGAHDAVKAGDEAHSTIDRAKSEIADAERQEAMNQFNNVADALTKNSQNQLAHNLFSIARTVGDVASTIEGQQAQSWIRHANNSVEAFHSQVRQVASEAQAIGQGGAGVGGAVSRVRANVALVGYVDLVVNFTRFDGILADTLAGVGQQIQLARAKGQLDTMRSQVSSLRTQIKSLHDSLHETLTAFDAQTAKVVDEAVAELTKE